MICLVTSSLNRCHCGKLQCFFENGTPFFKRTSYVYEIESILYRKKKKKFQITILWNIWWDERMDMNLYDWIQPKSLVVKVSQKLLCCIFKAPIWTYKCYSDKMAYYFCTQYFYLLKEKKNKCTQYQHAKQTSVLMYMLWSHCTKLLAGWAQ